MHHINSIVSMGVVLATLVATTYALYPFGGAANDRAIVIFLVLCLPSAGAFANYFLMQETR